MGNYKSNTFVNSILSRLEITAIALALVSAVFYAQGIAFHRAYLASFGLSAELFPLSVDQAMMQGFEAYVLMATRGIVRLLSTGLIIVLGIPAVLYSLSWCVDWVMNRSWGRQIKVRVRSWFFYEDGDDQPSTSTPLTGILVNAFGIVIGVCLLVIVILVATTFSAESGHYKAGLIQKSCTPGALGTNAEIAWEMTMPTAEVQYELAGKSIASEAKGCILATSAEFIAIYDKPSAVTISNARVISIWAETK